jgi:hypothetical protein
VNTKTIFAVVGAAAVALFLFHRYQSAGTGTVYGSDQDKMLREQMEGF